MRTFTFHLLDGEGEARAFELHNFASEHQARQELGRLFDLHVAAVAVEVWDENGQLFRAERARIEPPGPRLVDSPTPAVDGAAAPEADVSRARSPRLKRLVLDGLRGWLVGSSVAAAARSDDRHRLSGAP